MPPKFIKKKRKPRQKRTEAPKFCRFEKDGVFEVDYRDIGILGRYVSAQGKINARKRNGSSAFYQRQVTTAIKRARFLALLPYVGE
ncbi:MAG: 30S ribosomal protein S18 [Planctomycetes bacterium]|nr:30S ribosomal protein S18 [Planctomycetota bacterium]